MHVRSLHRYDACLARGAVNTHIRGGMRIAADGAGKISDFLQEARGQDYGSAIKRREGEDGIGKLLERVVDDLWADLEPVLSLAYAFEERMLQVSTHEGIMTFGIRGAQLNEENNKCHSRYRGREQILVMLQLVMHGFNQGGEHVDVDGVKMQQW